MTLSWTIAAAAAWAAFLTVVPWGPTAAARGRTGAYRNGLIAFVRCCGTPATGIYVIRQDGGGERKLLSAAHDDAPLTPAWSPDGTQIAFAPGAPRRGIWTMAANGARQRRVTLGGGGALFPSWSPGGKAIVFADLASPRASFHDLFVVGANGARLKRVTRAPADETDPSWAPNGNAIVYDRGRDLWSMKTDGSGQQLLLRNARAASWSPGGTTVAFVRAGDPWVARRDGSGAKRVTHLSAAAVSVEWSPDGRWLVTAPIDRGDLTLVRADGSGSQPLTHASGYFHAWPTWQRLRG